MKNILSMKVKDAYESCMDNTLADKIWEYKNPGVPIDKDDGEYKSWQNSTPFFIKAAYEAGLEELDVAFEVPTPLGGYVDVILIGNSSMPEAAEFGRLLVVELKQWSSIIYLANKDYVQIPVGSKELDIRRHPVSQIHEYESHLQNNHHGIYKNGHIKIDSLAYLHNLTDKNQLFENEYSCWNSYHDRVFTAGDINNLKAYLSSTFSSDSNDHLTGILDDCGYIMDAAGFNGLKAALSGTENARMVKDQMSIVDYVRSHLEDQKSNPHKEIIVISGAPGTGKTILGMHFIYDYACIFRSGKDADGAVFCLPKSKTVKDMIAYECGSEIAPYLDSIGNNLNLVVVDEAHRITGLDTTLDNVFDKGTKLLILFQDDHQRIRPGEDGTLSGICDYAGRKGINFFSKQLTIQKRCESLGKLLEGLNKMFYNEGKYNGEAITSVRTFSDLPSMDSWITKLSKTSRAKFIAPYCWRWNDPGKPDDIKICDAHGTILLQKSWNPSPTKEKNELLSWYYHTEGTDKVASVYTSQGLDFDDVAFIWWEDLIWDEVNNRWKVCIDKLKDNMHLYDQDKATGLWKHRIKKEYDGIELT